jgi:hypothetical protein
MSSSLEMAISSYTGIIHKIYTEKNHTTIYWSGTSKKHKKITFFVGAVIVGSTHTPLASYYMQTKPIQREEILRE